MSDRSEDLRVRRAEPVDEALLLQWRNDPWIVQRGASQRAVTPEEHRRWFQRVLKGEDNELYLVEIEGRPSGMVRYDLTTPHEAEISLYLLPPFPGRGYGTWAFLATAPGFLARRGIKRLKAEVLPENSASLRFFRKLGFVELETGEGGKVCALQLTCTDIPHSRPWVGDEEARAAAEVIRSRQLVQGIRASELEGRWTELTGTAHAACVGSGVGAIRLSLVALGIEPGDEVIVPAYSCVALLNAVLAIGGVPVLADVQRDRWTLAPADVRRRVTVRTKALVLVHLFGVPADGAALGSLGVPMLEDCAHGIGGRCGPDPFGAVGALSMASFYATKMLAGGEGGIVAGNDEELLERVRGARDYGDQGPDGRHLNDKLTDVEAALVLVQLGKLPSILAHRQERAARYGRWLAPLSESGLIVLPETAEGRIWYRYAIRLTGHSANRVVDAMAALGVRAEQPVWDLRATVDWDSSLEGSSLAYDGLLSLPLYPDLTEMEQRRVCSALGVCLGLADTAFPGE